MDKNKTYELMDVLKFIFAIFIIALHTGVATDFYNTTKWYIFTILLRLCVPFFFMVSGFFYGKKIVNKNIDEYSKKYIKRISIPLIFWLIIGLPYEYLFINPEMNLLGKISYIIRDLFFAQWGALWYLAALIVSVIMLNFFIKRKRIKSAVVIAILLFSFCLLSNSYYFLLNDTPFIGIVDKYLLLFKSPRNGLFAGFPLFLFGYLLSLKENKIHGINIRKFFLCLCLFLILEVIEVTLIRFKSVEYDFFIMTIPVVSMIMMICIKLREVVFPFNTIILRNYSSGLYYMHRPLYAYLVIFGLKLSPINTFIFIVLILLIVLTLLYKINNKYINMVIK